MPHSDQQHDATVSRDFVMQNIDFVRRLAIGMLGASQDVDDLVQEVFLRALRAYDSFRGDANVRTWIYRIATRVIYDHLDKKQKCREHDDETAIDVVADHRRANAESQFQHRERNMIVQAAVSELSPALRMAVALTYFEGLSVEQIAAIEGCTTSTVYWRLHEAKKQLKPKLEQYL